MLAPVRFIQLRFADGGINSSVFSLIQVTLGAGLLTFPYAVMQNGIVLGFFLIGLGGFVSWYTGMLLISAASHVNRVRYEDIALVMYGRKFAIATAIMNLLALVGFNMSYVVYVRIK
jgi:amino acid permease